MARLRRRLRAKRGSYRRKKRFLGRSKYRGRTSVRRRRPAFSTRRRTGGWKRSTGRSHRTSKRMFRKMTKNPIFQMVVNKVKTRFQQTLTGTVQINQPSYFAFTCGWEPALLHNLFAAYGVPVPFKMAGLSLFEDYCVRLHNATECKVSAYRFVARDDIPIAFANFATMLAAEYNEADPLVAATKFALSDLISTLGENALFKKYFHIKRIWTKRLQCAKRTEAHLRIRYKRPRMFTKQKEYNHANLYLLYKGNSFVVFKFVGVQGIPIAAGAAPPAGANAIAYTTPTVSVTESIWTRLGALPVAYASVVGGPYTSNVNDAALTVQSAITVQPASNINGPGPNLVPANPIVPVNLV